MKQPFTEQLPFEIATPLLSAQSFESTDASGVTSATIENATSELSFRDRFLRSHLGRTVIGGLTAVGLAASGGIVGASPAHAESNHTYTVTGTDGEGVWLHSDPGLGDENDLIKIMPEGTSFDAGCYVNDTPIGSRGNPVWLYGRDELGSEGYFTDFHSSSKWSQNNTLQQQGLPLCGESAVDEEPELFTPDQSEPEEMITSVPYDGDRAADWARDNARETPPQNASCTWFVSKALWNGGLPKDANWTDAGQFGRVQKRPGTKSAWAVDHLQSYIMNEYPQTEQLVLDGERFMDNAVPEASVGDVIVYDWEGDGELDHASIVTDIVGNSYPEVAEWSIYDGREPTPYTERGWTWSEKSQTWLQSKNPNIVAYLWDIDTTQTGTY